MSTGVISAIALQTTTAAIEKVVNQANLLAMLSFIIFCLVVLLPLILAFLRPQTAVEPNPPAELEVGGGVVAAIADAFARLADALTKASPAVVAILASAFFMMVATYAATSIPGSDRGDPKMEIRGSASGQQNGESKKKDVDKEQSAPPPGK